MYLINYFLNWNTLTYILILLYYIYLTTINNDKYLHSTLNETN